MRYTCDICSKDRRYVRVIAEDEQWGILLECIHCRVRLHVVKAYRMVKLQLLMMVAAPSITMSYIKELRKLRK